MITLYLRVYMCVEFKGCILHSGVYAMSSVQHIGVLLEEHSSYTVCIQEDTLVMV